MGKRPSGRDSKEKEELRWWLEQEALFVCVEWEWEALHSPKVKRTGHDGTPLQSLGFRRPRQENLKFQARQG